MCWGCSRLRSARCNRERFQRALFSAGVFRPLTWILQQASTARVDYNIPEAIYTTCLKSTNKRCRSSSSAGHQAMWGTARSGEAPQGHLVATAPHLRLIGIGMAGLGEVHAAP